MQAIDAAASEPVDVLIERAGRRVARSALQMLGGVYGRRVSVIAGKGNNGADALVAAQRLRTAGVKVAVVAPDQVVPPAHLVIDGAYGTGLSRDYRADAVPAGTQVLAIDIPSGVDGLTGELHGTPVAADRTVTFAALKPGLLLHPGAAFVGDLEVADIGLDVSSARSWLITESDVAASLPERAPTDHKWSRSVLVVGGSAGMAGAPRLASDAAVRSGAGIVHCLLPDGSAPTEGSEVVFRTLPATGWAGEAIEASPRFDALVIGPGLGPDTTDDVTALLSSAVGGQPMVLDGTALRLLGERPALRPSAVLTPHDGEFAALAGRATSADRFADARELADATNATVLLKGPLTIVASPDGRCLACAHGDTRLATAGSGDVLAGIIASFLAAGLEPLIAAATAAWVHADTGRRLPLIGGAASDLVESLPLTLSVIASGRSGGRHAAN